jgi:hypothetical protein
MSLSIPKLDPKEAHFCIASYIEGLTLFLRYMPPNAHQTDTPKIVLYVHGGSFPSALSIAHRFDSRSWRDELADAGFHVWGLDFHGLAPQTPIRRWGSPPNAIPRSVAPKGRANRSNGPYVSSATIMACRKSRSSRIPGARSQSVDLLEDAPILSIGWFSSDRSRGARRRQSLRLLPLGVSSR